jgi:hypothetical protein
MSSANLARRQVLAALCALGVASSPFAHAASGSMCPTLIDGTDAAALRELAAQLGPAEKQIATPEIIAALQRDLAAVDALARINECVMTDYARDRVVQLGEWRVSHTEAALYVTLSRCT